MSTRAINIAEFLLDLYRGAQSYTAEKFPPFAMELIRKFVDFDMALMGIIKRENQILGIQFRYQHDEDDSVFDEWASISNSDVLAIDVLEKPRTGIIYKAHGLIDTPELMDFAIRNRHLNIMAAGVPYSPDGSHLVVSLRRTEKRLVFGGREPETLPSLLAHIAEAFRINQSLCARNVTAAPSKRGVCIFDKSGIVIFQDESFSKLSDLYVQHSYKVPNFMLMMALSGSKSLNLDGLTFEFEQVRNLFFLTLKPASRLTLLTRREFAVAKFYGTGLSHKDIGLELQISPSTVRRHIESVYAKLKVNNKAALASLVQGVSLESQR